MYNARIIHLYIYIHTVSRFLRTQDEERRLQSKCIRARANERTKKKGTRQRRTTTTTIITEARDGVYFTNGRAWDAIGLTELYLRMYYYRHHYYGVHTCPSYYYDKSCITRGINTRIISHE